MTQPQEMDNWCPECAMDDVDRAKNELKVYKCPRCDEWTDEPEEDEHTMRKLYNACLYAFQWHCGNGTAKAEEECMSVLQEAIEAYNQKRTK